jgi:hypothetical protein
LFKSIYSVATLTKKIYRGKEREWKEKNGSLLFENTDPGFFWTDLLTLSPENSKNYVVG